MNKTSYRRIIRLNEYSKQQFLYFLTNKLGFDVEICHNYQTNNQLYFSKWKSFLWLLQYEPTEYIKELHCTRDQFIEKASHRSVLDIELLIDIDDKGRFKSIENKKNHLVKQLRKENVDFACYHSGGKGYHISILLPELRDGTNSERKLFKEFVLNKLGADLNKAVKRNVISLENEPHRKTGKIKELVCYE